jgi:FAD/FMN-containing dehydrogenase
VLDYLPDARAPLTSPHPWYALIELVALRGATDRLDQLTETVFTEAMERELLADAVIASSEQQAEDFWQLRESISPAERAIGPAMQHDISVPVDRMPEFVDSVSPEIERTFPGTLALGFGHLGDGNIHYHVLAPADAIPGDWEASDGKAISAMVHDRVTEFGGSISAEHGIGQMKRDELGRLGDPVALGMMRAVKQALDPQGILNPGKLVPLAPSAAST